MRRSTALRTAVLLAAAAAAGVLLALSGDGDAPPAAGPADPPAPAPPPSPPPPSPEGPPLPLPERPPPPSLTPSQPYMPSGLVRDLDFEVPEGERGPVVVGVVTRAGDPDPECWVALESVEDPARRDGSRLEELDAGGFLLRGFTPGRYRVRARMDGAAAVYSRAFDAEAGVVVDAGILVLQDDGAIAGVAVAPGGGPVDGEVNLFGRDPADLRLRVVATARSIGRQGFQLPPHESGPFLLSLEAEEGWALHEGTTDDRGLAWCEVPLRAWGTVEVAALPEGAEAVTVILEPVKVPDLGHAPRRLTPRPGERVERVLPGRWRATLRRGTWSGVKEIDVEEGRVLALDLR